MPQSRGIASSGLSKAGRIAGLLVLMAAIGWAIWRLEGKKQTSSGAENKAAEQSSSASEQSEESPQVKPSPSPRRGREQTRQAIPHLSPPQVPNPSAGENGKLAGSVTGDAAGNVAGNVKEANPPASPTVSGAEVSRAFFRTYSASRDGFANGCHGGVLTFSGSAMTFTCPSDRSKNVSVNAASVIGIDKNGILVQPKQRFHFHLNGGNSHDSTSVFEEWLKAAKINAAPSGN